MKNQENKDEMIFLHHHSGHYQSIMQNRETNALLKRKQLNYVIIITKIRMELKESHWTAHRKYTKISIKRRQKLVNMVVFEGLPIARVAKVLRLNISTAKLIIKKYEQTGELFNKKMSKSSEPSKKTVQSINIELKCEEIPKSEIKLQSNVQNQNPHFLSTNSENLQYWYYNNPCISCYPINIYPPQ